MKTTRTEAQKQEWKGAMQELARQVRSMSPQEREAVALRCGTITAEGHALSVYNTCFLWTQAGRVLVQVGGFRQWERVGRKVREGEHAAGYIYVPMSGKKRDDDEPETAEERATGMRFRLVPVFDVSQTIESEVV